MPKYKVEVAGINSWTIGAPAGTDSDGKPYEGKQYAFRQGVHIVDWDESIVEAAKHIRQGVDSGGKFGVYVSKASDSEQLTGPSRSYHDYPPAPTPHQQSPPVEEKIDLTSNHGAVETEPGVFEPANKTTKRSSK